MKNYKAEGASSTGFFNNEASECGDKHEIAVAAGLYLQGKTSDRIVRAAALEAVRMIAGGCRDPAEKAQSVLDLELHAN